MPEPAAQWGDVARLLLDLAVRGEGGASQIFLEWHGLGWGHVAASTEGDEGD